MRYVVCAIAIVYALLSLYAGATQLKNPARRKSSRRLLVGGVILLAAGILELIGRNFAWLVTVIGSLLICQAALINGQASGRTKLQNHAVRFMITVFLILGMLFW
jgi:hypothetical protein